MSVVILEQAWDEGMALSLATALVKHFEGFSDRSYLCPAGKWTIGYGRTGDVARKQVTTREAEEKWLTARLKSELDWLLKQFPDIRPHEGAALASLVYNIGRFAAENSTLWRRLHEIILDDEQILATRKESAKVRRAWFKWVKFRNRKTRQYEDSPDLLVRRWAEFRLWNTSSIDMDEIVRRQTEASLPAEDMADFPTTA